MSIQVFETQIICRVGPRQTSVTKNNSIQFQDEGSSLGSAGDIDTIDFVGAGVVAAKSGSKITVTVSSSGGGSSVWGGITGTLANQLDLQAALDAKQAIDGDLTTIAALTPSNDDFLQRKSGAWTNRTIAQVRDDLAVWKRVYLSGDVTNNNGVADTLQDVTALSFPVVANKKFAFRFVIPYTSASVNTGAHWAINGPTLTELNYYSITTVTVNSQGVRFESTYNAAGVVGNSLTSGNLAQIVGIIECSSAASEVIARFASEVAGSAIVAKAGAYVEYIQLN